MQIILLDENKFDEFAIKHQNCNYYQSSCYGKFMKKHGFNSYYLGLSDGFEIKAATLIIVKNEEITKRKMGYAPRGFLIDWDDIDLVSEFTNKLKDFLASRGFVYLKVDPKIIYKEHNIDGSEKNSNANTNFIKKLQELGYIHMGFNNGFETSKPRWDCITYLDPNITNLYNSISKEARNKIKIAINSGTKIYKGESKDIELFYTIVDKKNPPIEYYYDLYEFFGDKNFKLFFAKLMPNEFVNSSKKAYEDEEKRNSMLNLQIQNYNVENKEEIINEKLKSDELLNEYKKQMLNAIDSFQKFPNGLYTATCIVIEFGNTATFFMSDYDNVRNDKTAEYLLKWQLIEDYAKKGYKLIDINGMPGTFNNDYKIKINTEMANKIVEYVGEFDLVINKKAYYTGTKINPIINWLNKPI